MNPERLSQAAIATRWLSCCSVVLACAFSSACGGSSGSSTKNAAPVVAVSGANVLPIAVNSGPAGLYVDGAFASATVCVPGSSTCQTIDGLLVDTGSSGLRILSSALTVSLPQLSTSGGTTGQAAASEPIAECLPFLGSYTWGPVQAADVEIAGEKASSLPVQVLSDTAYPVPQGCTNFGLPSANSLSTLGANGILGVGFYAQDCGAACAAAGTANPGLYYTCPSSGCQVAAVSATQQVQNPVSLFSSDNNGVIIELPAVSAPAASLSGSLVFGIGTQSNNALNGATVYAADQNGNLTTAYKGKSYSTSFIDSGSNGYYFLDSTTTGIPDCTDLVGFYCPSSTQNVSATVQGANGNSGTVSFSIANADTLFSNNTDTVFNQLGGPSSNMFDFGLPFFFGRNVFTAIEGKPTPGGTGPYWAY
jgi:hypothetical protein